ncbi:MAG: DUF5688 family protein [bacterium]|nr:DUF5688 family protein [bacterium]
MEYNQFVDDVKNCIRVKVDEEYEVKVNRIKKNNSVVLDGIVLFKEGDTISPNIYLNSYYSRYMDGESVDTIADDIINMYQESKRSQAPEYEQFEFSFEQVKDKIIYRLINYNKNTKLLEEVPFVRFLDLAITFHCLVKQDEDGIGTIRITNEHAECFGVTVKELMQLAIKNTTRLFPIKISSMEEVIYELMKRDFYELCPIGDCEGDEMFRQMMSQMLPDESAPKMYILSNETGINGATAMLYRDGIKEFANRLDSDLYILPSSIHEVILVPYDETLRKEELRNMVCEVNSSQVPIDEVLSDKVYIYHRKNNRVEI